MFRHLHRDHLAAHADFAIGGHRRIDHHLTPLDFLNLTPDFEGDAQWRRAQILDLERRRHESMRRQGVHCPPVGPVGRRRRCSRAMAVDQGGDQAAIDVARNGDVLGVGSERRNRFVAVPVAFKLVTVFVAPATTVAMAQFFGIVILKGFGAVHSFSLSMIGAVKLSCAYLTHRSIAGKTPVFYQRSASFHNRQGFCSIAGISCLIANLRLEIFPIGESLPESAMRLFARAVLNPGHEKPHFLFDSDSHLHYDFIQYATVLTTL